MTKQSVFIIRASVNQLESKHCMGSRGDNPVKFLSFPKIGVADGTLAVRIAKAPALLSFSG